MSSGTVSVNVGTTEVVSSAQRMTETLPELLKQWADERERGVVQKGRSGTLLLKRAAKDLESLARIQEAALGMPTHPTPEQWEQFWRTLDESFGGEQDL